jgi:hypothetical protein
MKKLLVEEPSTSDLISLWKPRAFSIALISPNPDPVGKFLETKHIPKHEASMAAILIWNEAQKTHIKAKIPTLIMGFGILGFGLAIIFSALGTSLLMVAAGMGLVAFGAGILLSGYLDRR